MPGAVYGSDRIDADVAIFDYVSGIRRRLGFSPNIIDVARELNSHLDALQYKRIILVGHSMGGIICSMAIRLSHQKTPFGHSEALIHRAVGLIALASPRSGARAVILAARRTLAYSGSTMLKSPRTRSSSPIRWTRSGEVAVELDIAYRSGRPPQRMTVLWTTSLPLLRCEEIKSIRSRALTHRFCIAMTFASG